MGKTTYDSKHVCNFYCHGDIHCRVIGCSGTREWTAEFIWEQLVTFQPHIEPLSIVPTLEYDPDEREEDAVFIDTHGNRSCQRLMPITSRWRVTYRLRVVEDKG